MNDAKQMIWHKAYERALKSFRNFIVEQYGNVDRIIGPLDKYNNINKNKNYTWIPFYTECLGTKLRNPLCKTTCSMGRC